MMNISDADLEAMTVAELDSLANKANLISARKKRKVKLIEDLPGFVERVILAVHEQQKQNKDKPHKFQRYVDMSVTSQGFFHADEVNALPEYEQALAALREELKLPVKIYQGYTRTSTMGDTDNNPDAHVQVDLQPTAGSESVAAVLERLKR